MLGGKFAEVSGGSYGCEIYTFTGDDTVVIGAGASVSVLPEKVQALGDANGDGKTDLVDIIRILKYIATDSVEISPAADYNADSTVDILDALLILKGILSK